MDSNMPPHINWRVRLKAVANLRPLMRLIWEASPVLTSTSICTRVVIALGPVVRLWLGKLIIDQVIAIIKGQSAHYGTIWVYLLCETVLVITNKTLTVVNNLSECLLADRFGNLVNIRMMQHASILDLSTLEDPVFEDKLEMARRQTASRISLLLSLGICCEQLVMLASLCVGMLTFSPYLLLLMLVTAVPAFCGEAQFATLGYSLLFRWTAARREMDYLSFLGLSKENAKEIKICGLGRHLTERMRQLFEHYYQSNKHLALRRARARLVLGLFPIAAYYTAYAIILRSATLGVLSVGTLTFLAGVFERSRTAIERIFTCFTDIAEQAFYAKDLFEFFHTAPRMVIKPRSTPVPARIRTGFEFWNVSFSYPGSDRKIIDSVSFKLSIDERVAIVGRNGVGKTTIIKLLTRLYDPTDGVIMLDGIDLREYDVDSLRCQIAIIFQDYLRFDMLVRENIGFGKVEDLFSIERIAQAARKGCSESLISTFPSGYDQMLGRRFENGLDLSLGQWQKIALARACMRDTQIFILDEPTASLDARAEYELFHRFADLTRGRLAVLISHRFSTVRMADRILVLDDGKICEDGTHAELMSLSGRYAEMFELQCCGYK